MRRRLLDQVGPGAAYVPFCGDGDIAVELYSDRRIYAADLDADRVAAARVALPESATVVVADCDSWPFAGSELDPIAVADFDAYVYPYEALRAWWSASAPMADRVAIFGTDGELQATQRRSQGRMPDGPRRSRLATNERRSLQSVWWSRYVRPYLCELLEAGGLSVLADSKYLRLGHQLYWGVVVGSAPVREAPQPAPTVREALYEAAQSGNVAAMELWLDRYERQRGPEGA